MPPIRKNGCGKQLPQPKTHTTPADRQAMTTHRAERYANFPRKAQRTGRSSPPDTMSCRSSAGNQVHPLNSSLIFSYPTTRAAKKQPSFAAHSSFYRLKHGKDRLSAVFFRSLSVFPVCSSGMIQKNRKGGLTYGGHHIHLHGVRRGGAEPGHHPAHRTSGSVMFPLTSGFSIYIIFSFKKYKYI